jgi:cell wall assembly regulator SMI1
MSNVERLDTDQLEQLERMLAEQHAPVVRRFRPPASQEALAMVETYLGLPLPEELRQWWEWHDGTDVEAPELAVEGSIGPGFRFQSTTRAVESSRRSRADAEVVVPEDPDSSWASSWVAIGSGGRVACECRVEPDAPVPVLDVDYHKAAYPGVVAARSLGEMVRWWIEAIESGAWRFDVDANQWQSHEELMPPERERSGLL